MKMKKLVVFEPFSGFSTISPEFDATNDGKAQWLCLRPWAGLNIYARGDGWGLISMPEAVGGVYQIGAGLHGYARRVSYLLHQMALFNSH